MADKEFLTYKGKPLVRSGSTIYYGDSGEKVIIRMEVLSSRTDGGLEISDDVQIDLIYSDEKAHKKDLVIKTSKKKGLNNAMDIGAIWLERTLNDNK